MGLDRFFGASRGSAILADIPRRLVLASRHPYTNPAAPGSVLKPLVLSALLRSGKLTAEDSFLCPGKLTIGGRNFTCSHPPLAAPAGIQTALAYSCNCWMAHFASRFAPGELVSSLGFLSRVRPATEPDAVRMQALGAWGVLATVSELAEGYRSLALACRSPEMQPILEGLEGAVEFGTAQLARVPGLRVAGKTGTAEGIAWFAGFAPSRAPAVVVSVMVQGRSGGADAAPIAAKILEAWWSRR